MGMGAVTSENVVVPSQGGAYSHSDSLLPDAEMGGASDVSLFDKLGNRDGAVAGARALMFVKQANNKEFASLLQGDNCARGLGKFAEENAGRVVEFDGSIAALAPHGNYNSRYDILIGPGDDGPNSAVGPSFKFEDVSIYDLNFKAPTPQRIGTGDLLRVTSEVGEYNAQRCLFFLEPVETRIRK